MNLNILFLFIFLTKGALIESLLVVSNGGYFKRCYGQGRVKRVKQLCINFKRKNDSNKQAMEGYNKYSDLDLVDSIDV